MVLGRPWQMDAGVCLTERPLDTALHGQVHTPDYCGGQGTTHTRSLPSLGDLRGTFPTRMRERTPDSTSPMDRVIFPLTERLPLWRSCVFDDTPLEFPTPQGTGQRPQIPSLSPLSR